MRNPAGAAKLSSGPKTSVIPKMIPIKRSLFTSKRSHNWGFKEPQVADSWTRATKSCLRLGANLGGMGNVSPPIIWMHPPNFMPHISERDDLFYFFNLHFILDKKLVIWEVITFFWGVFTSFWAKIWATARVGYVKFAKLSPPNLQNWQKMVNFAKSSPQCST